MCTECLKLRKQEIDRGFNQLMFLFQYNNQIRCQNNSILKNRNEHQVRENIGSKKIYNCKKLMSDWLQRYNHTFDWDIQAVMDTFSNNTLETVKNVLNNLNTT